MDLPAYTEHESLLNNYETKELLNLLDIDNSVCKESHVFNRITKENVVNKHLRSSQKIEYRDNKLFDWIETNVVKKICNNYISYHLIRNDLEVVKYKKGDYFKKHQDYINFDSNEFKNYTFLICLNPCEFGGETVLHIDDQEYIFDCTAKIPGSLLLFKKDTIHEGKEVLEGEKYILKGNLLGFVNNNKEMQDIIIVSLKKSPGLQYILPVNRINDTMYGAYYNFSKQQNPHENIFYFYDEETNKDSFEYFYNTYVKEYTLKEFYNRRIDLDYMGIKETNLLSELTQFINDKNTEIMMLSYDNYYKLCNINFGKEIVPFNMVTLKTENIEIIIWCGVYNNLFVTCDPCVRKITYNSDFLPKIFLNNSRSESDSESGSESDSESDSGSDSNFYSESKKKSIEKDLIELFQNFKINDSILFVPNLEWKQYVDKYLTLGVSLVRSHLWKNYGLTPINKLTMIKKNNNESLHEYVMNIMDGISKINNGYSGDDGQYNYESSSKLQLINNINGCYENIKSDKIEVNDLNNLNLNKFVENILNAQYISKLDNTKMSESFCNETYYVTWDIIYRMGFIKINNYLENKSNY